MSDDEMQGSPDPGGPEDSESRLHGEDDDQGLAPDEAAEVPDKPASPVRRPLGSALTGSTWNTRMAANVIGPLLRAVQQQQRQVAEIFSRSTSRAVMRNLEQQRMMAELVQGPAFQSWRQSHLQMARLASTAVARALAQQEESNRLLMNQFLSSMQFQNSYLAQVQAVTAAVSKIQLDPGWQIVIQRLQKSPEVSRWATAMADALDAEEDTEPEVQQASEAVADSTELREALEQAAESDIEPFEDLIAVSSRTLRGSQAADETPSTPESSDEAETYKALLKLWGAGNVVAAVLLAGLLSGQVVVVLVILGGLAQVSGYTIKDLIEMLRKSDENED